MGLKEVIVGLLGAGTILGCNGNVPNQKNVEQPAQVASSYNVVSVDQLLKSEGENLVEIYARPKRRNDYDSSSEISAWNYSASHAGCKHEVIGYNSLPELIDGLREGLVGKEGLFTGVLLHSYDLTEQQRDKIASGLGVGKVAYVETPPPAKEPSPGGVRHIDMGGVIITTGGGRGITITM